MKISKILLASAAIGAGILIFNTKAYASNSYYLMSCTEQNIPTGYYSSIDTTVSEAEFREDLHDVISNNYTAFTYDQAWEIDYYADADPYEEGHVKCLYTDQAVDNLSHTSSGGRKYWNREHTWPKTHGFNDSKCSPYSDCHHLRAAESAINIAKSNNDFGEIDTASEYKESYGNKYAGGVFEPKDEVKGDVARMLLYMMIRYGEYDDTLMSYKEKVDGVDVTKTEKVNLSLVDGVSTTSNSNGNGTLANLSTILKWHYQDPVSDREIYQNNVVYMFQKNRNPFIDHPEYVEYAFADSGEYVNPTPSDPVEPDTQLRTEEYAIESLGFEIEEGFTAADYYTKQKYETKNLTWTGYNAVPATADAIRDAQSLRYSIKANSLQKAQFFMTKDVYNLSRITFTAKASMENLPLKVMYSIDSGVTWNTGETFYIPTAESSYEYVLSANGGYDKARIGFVVDSTSESTISLIMDNLNVYRFKTDAGTEFTRENTKSSLRFNYDSEVVTIDGYQYQLATSASEITTGKEIVITPLDIVSHPYALGAVATTSSGGEGSNHTQTPITVKDNKITALGAANILTVGAGSVAGTISLKDSGGKYLGNGTATGNNLKRYASMSESTSFNLSIDATTHAASLVIVKESVTKNTVRYNSTSGVFSCYSSGQKDIAIYVKTSSSYEQTNYSYSNMKIRFGAFLDKDLYEYILDTDANASFGVILSKDGINYDSYICTPAMVTILDGVVTQDENGSYAQWATVIPTEEENYASLVYAQAFVIINGETYYMSETCYSVKTLAEYYIDHLSELGLTEEQNAVLQGILS